MALIQFGGGVTDIRGSIAGTTFSKNRYGNYARGRVTPVNPNSSRQQAIRNILGQLVEAWSQLTTKVQRDGWAVYAANVNFTNKLGEQITLTGFNHYIRSNVARLNAGMTRVDTAPVVLILPGTDGTFNVTMSEATQLATVNFNDGAAWCSENSAIMTLHQGIPKNSAVSFYGNHFRFLGKFLGSAGSPITSPQTVAVDFPIALDQRDWVFGRIQRADARLSEKFRDDTVVTA